jgi:hypothetical protein
VHNRSLETLFHGLLLDMYSPHTLPYKQERQTPPHMRSSRSHPRAPSALSTPLLRLVLSTLSLLLLLVLLQIASRLPAAVAFRAPTAASLSNSKAAAACRHSLVRPLIDRDWVVSVHDLDHVDGLTRLLLNHHRHIHTLTGDRPLLLFFLLVLLLHHERDQGPSLYVTWDGHMLRLLSTKPPSPEANPTDGSRRPD